MTDKHGALRVMDADKRRFRESGRLAERLTHPSSGIFGDGTSSSIRMPLVARALAKQQKRREPQRVKPDEGISWDDLPVPRGYKVVNTYDEAKQVVLSKRRLNLYIPILGFRGQRVAIESKQGKNYISIYLDDKSQGLCHVNFYENGDIEGEGLEIPLDSLPD